MKYLKILSALIVMVLVSVSASLGQVTSTVQATGTVLEPISVATATNLDFGTSIFPGNDEVVAITDAGAAQFDIDGETGKEVTITFSMLPENLTHETDASTLPITFSTSDGGHNTSDDPTGATTFDPNTTTATTTLGTTSGLLYVYLGGTVSPADNQTSGAYSADVTVEFAYTGN